MDRFYVSPDAVSGNRIYLGKSQTHHLKNVLRRKKGDKITVFDGKGNEYETIITAIDRRQTAAYIKSSRFTLAKDASYKTVLFQALSKNAKMDLAVEKAVELGVGEIVLLKADRCIVKMDDRAVLSKGKRWQKIAAEASRQCGRTIIPAVKDFLTVKAALCETRKYDLKLFFCINKETVKLQDILAEWKVSTPKAIAVFIGPEGDWTQDEISMAKSSNCRLVSLGERVLRTETAGLYVLSVLDYVFS